MSEKEMLEIKHTKLFRNGSDFPNKQFWLTEDGLKNWISNPKFSEPFNMKLKVNKSLLQFEHPYGLDGFPALSIPEESMHILNENFIYESIHITPLKP